MREGATQAYAYTGACLLAGRGGLAAGCSGAGMGGALRGRGGAIPGLGGALWRAGRRTGGLGVAHGLTVGRLTGRTGRKGGAYLSTAMTYCYGLACGPVAGRRGLMNRHLYYSHTNG